MVVLLQLLCSKLKRRKSCLPTNKFFQYDPTVIYQELLINNKIAASAVLVLHAPRNDGVVLKSIISQIRIRYNSNYTHKRDD